MPPHRAPDCVKQDINKTILKSVLILLLSRRSHRNLEPSKKQTDSDVPECLPVFPSVQSSFPFEVGKLLTSSSKIPNSKMAAALLTNKSKRLVFYQGTFLLSLCFCSRIFPACGVYFRKPPAWEHSGSGAQC